MKCQQCNKMATLHITEINGEKYEELHFCEDCAQKYLNPQTPSGNEEELAALNQRQCPNCGIKFSDFRASGRLGCAHDYEVFQEDLLKILESIHGQKTHSGKIPHRQPHARRVWAELMALRKQLQHAVSLENYEEAARLRDRIRRLEEVV